MVRAVNIFILTLLLISPMRSFSQTVNFEKLFKHTDILYSIQQTTDNGYILSGLVSENGESFAKLIKTDSDGDTLWTKSYPSISKTHQYKTAAIQTSDGGYLLTGSIEESANIEVFLIKFDALGETIWEKTYGDSLEDKSWCLQQTADNGYLISAFHNTNHAHLIKIDSVGIIEWEWDFGPILSLDRRYQAIQTSDQGYAIVIKMNLYKLDNTGDSLWTRTLGKNFSLIQENDDKSLIMAGRHILMKTDSLGNEIWLKEELSIFPNVLRATIDGEYVLANDQLLNIDGDGEEQWRVEVDGTIYSLQQASDGGYVFCGGELASPFIDNGWFVKTDQNGFYRSLILIQPEEGERIQFNVDYSLTWRQINVDQINISFSANNGLDWDEISSSEPSGSGVFIWHVPFLLSDECKIRLTASDQPELYSENEQPFSIISRQYDYIAVNQIKMWFSNDGDGSHHPDTNNHGFFWPGGIEATKSAVFEDGLVFAGMINGDYYSGGNYYRQGLQPGNILEDGSAANPDSNIFGIWKIRRDWGIYPPGQEKDRLEHDYQNWPVDLGAPWIDNNGDGIYDPEIDQPKLYGDETNWVVMNDLDSIRTQRLAGCDPIGLEIQCLVYGYDRQDALADVVFKRYRIINKANNFVDDMAFGYWADVDLGYAGDDFAGCDTLLDLAYCYNASNSDEIYGSPPPAVGYLFLQGPVIEGEPGDSAWYNEGWMSGYKNLCMTSFSFYMVAEETWTWDPSQGDENSAFEWYNNLRGLDIFGNPVIDPTNSEKTGYPFYGDPVAGTGWYEGPGWPGNEDDNGGDRYMTMASGSFDLAPGDSQEIEIAIIMALGDDHLDSVKKLKEKAAAVRQFYFTGDLTALEELENRQPAAFVLRKNYPNPFNPKTIINYELQITNDIDLSIYNVLGQKVATLVSEKQTAGSHQVEWDGARFASGVYYYVLKAGEFRDVKKMVLVK